MKTPTVAEDTRTTGNDEEVSEIRLKARAV